MHPTLARPHAWDVSLEQAQWIQTNYRQKVIFSPLPIEQQNSLTAVAAADWADRVFAVAVTVDLDRPYLEIRLGTATTTFPYRTGYLAFHQGPAILQAIEQLNRVGNVIIVKGHGLAHPRRFGLASHLGVLLDIPTIGYAQALLPHNELQPSPNPLVFWVTDAEGAVGVAVYTDRVKKPCILSIGHRVDLESLLAFIHLWMKDHRQPAPLRLARSFLRQQLRNMKKE
ncbi:MAG: hypothetical protein DDG59_08985 [Anaerolineae bacterium]|nr:MAG: hypothetical protein DDG59_08985 [Anaerolineae bacterium]